jgi:hypothetical protein
VFRSGRSGGRRVVYLGKHGSPESQVEYRRIRALLQAQPAGTPPRLATGRPTNLSVNELLLAFMRWAATHYRTADGGRSKAHGLEAAQVLLGQSRADVTQIYAEKNEALAITVAANIG